MSYISEPYLRVEFKILIHFIKLMYNLLKVPHKKQKKKVSLTRAYPRISACFYPVKSAQETTSLDNKKSLLCVHILLCFFVKKNMWSGNEEPLQIISSVCPYVYIVWPSDIAVSLLSTLRYFCLLVAIYINSIKSTTFFFQKKGSKKTTKTRG